MLRHLCQFGLQVNWEKSKFSPMQRISFLDMELHSVAQTVCLREHAQSVYTLCKVREDEEQVLLVAPYWPTRTWLPELMHLGSPSLAHSSEEGSSETGHIWKLHVWSLDGTRRF